MSQYENKTAVISGGAEGIGLSVAQALGAQGMNIVLADISQENLDKAEQQLRDAGVPVLAVTLDVAQEQQWQTVADQAIEKFGKIHMLVNNAGVGGDVGPIDTIDSAGWQWTVDVNLMGVVYGAHAVYKVMLDQGFGHIVNTASMAGLISTPGLSSYAATKHAVVGLTRSMRVEGARRGVRVSAFCPGVIRTAILDDGGVYGKFSGAGLASPTEAELQASRAMDVDAFAAAALKRGSMRSKKRPSAKPQPTC